MEHDHVPAPYAGEPLVADDSYLRRLPVCLHAKERLRFDALVTAADIVTQAFAALRQATSEMGIEVDNFGNGERAYVLSLCWTLVDQLHAIRQLIRPSPDQSPGPLTQAFLDAAETATILRNRMDHLAQNLDNLAKATGPKPPLFGSLSYAYAPGFQTGTREFHVVVVMSGALHGDHAMPLVNPLGKQLTLPTGLFVLSAFWLELDFARVIGCLRDLLKAIEPKIEEDLRRQVVERSQSEGEINQNMATHGGGLTLIFAMTINDGGPQPPPMDTGLSVSSECVASNSEDLVQNGA